MVAHTAAPPHSYGAHEGVPDAPFASGLHTPSVDAPAAFEHTSHRSLHGESQHTPSTHWAEAQSTAAAQVAPFFLRHEPPSSQVMSPAQVSASSPPLIGAQRPIDPGTLHASHAPHCALPQQTPSTQNAPVQSASFEQVLPALR